MKFKYILIIILLPFLCCGQEVKNYEQLTDGVNIVLDVGTLNISSMADNAVRIKYYKNAESNINELIFSSTKKTAKLKITESTTRLELKGEKIIVVVNKQTGKLSFADNTGKVFLSEKSNSRKFIPDSVMGEPCFVAEQSFVSPDDEFIFGLGQFQDGHHNLRNVTRRLTQVNSQISLPFIYSSKGYGLLWHQYGLTDFNPAENFINLEKKSSSSDNELAEVTTTSGTQKISQNQSLFTGKFVLPEDGTYSIFLDLDNMDNRHYVVIDGKVVIDQSNLWLPPTVCSFVELKAGEHQVQIICKSENTPKLSWKVIDNLTTFRSPHSQMIDYIVFYGPSADSVISSYRNLSGNVPMLPRWAYGFWQCRERYSSSEELISTVKEFRKRKLPLDVIVQDWQYWGKRGWGVPQFDETNYSNPAGFIKELHDLNAHFNISIWSNPDKNSEIGKKYVADNRFIPETKWLDYFNPETGKEYWQTLNENLFVHGVDSWWMDATEPENDALHNQKTFIGPGDFYRLTYPLYVSKSVYEGQRKTSSDKRVCILTRSAFLGQQRYGTINWSGDINGTWDSYKRQIVAGLNYTITGMPYWTTDIGGFFRPGKSQYSDENFRELLIRWFQWGTFNPIFRIHGYQSETEPWKYGDSVENNMRKMLNLRYKLLPYIYSEAWQITKNGSTIMRPLVMDFIKDSEALNPKYEYMFGKAFLVAPVTEPKVKEMDVYLPKFTSWYDFWTGEYFEGGKTIKASANIDEIPLFVRAGSIIPIGPSIQYAEEKNDPIEIRIYPGGNCEYNLYEDEDDNYNYENENYSIITFKWDDTKKVLTINERKGSFHGMLNERKFNIIYVSKNKGAGMDVCKKMYDKVVTYDGKEVIVKL